MGKSLGSQRSEILVLSLMIGFQGLLLAYTAWKNYPTYDEWMHVASGIYNWEYGEFSPYRVNPPLTRMLATLPLVLSGIELDAIGYLGPGNRGETEVAGMLITGHGERTLRHVFIARMMLIPIPLIGTILLYVISKARFSGEVRFVAPILWAFSPTTIANGALVTPDTTTTVCLFACCWAFYIWLRESTSINTVVFGVLFGLLLLSRTSWIVLEFVFPLILMGYLIRHRGQRWQRIWKYGSSVLLALFVVAAGYGFQGVFRPLGEFLFVSSTFAGSNHGSVNRFSSSWLGRIPVPLPEMYLIGLDQQRSYFESGRPSYFLGRWHEHGNFAYYATAHLLKEPVCLVLLYILGVLSAFCSRKVNHSRECWSYLIVLGFPVLVHFLLASLQTGNNRHYRYVMPVLPLLFLLVSAGLQQSSQRIRPAVILLIVGYVASSVYAVPRSHAYFSEAVGGSRHGWKYLTNSNVDWGQDLAIVREFMANNTLYHPVYLIYPAFGRVSNVGVPCENDESTLLGPSRVNEGQRVPLRHGYYLVSPTKYILEDLKYFRDRVPLRVIEGEFRLFRVTRTESDPP